MFDGLTYRRFGLNLLCIGFSERQRDDLLTCLDGGVVTLAYASEFRAVEKDRMAKRLLAALNLTSHLPLEDLESAEPMPSPESRPDSFDTRAFCRLPGSRNLVIGFDGRCPVHGVFGKNGGFAMVTYADEIERPHRAFMASRIVAAMNYTRYVSLDSLELLVANTVEKTT